MSEQQQNQDKPNEEKSAAQIERDIDRTRAELDDTLDNIFNRLTPGELFEQTIDYMRSSHGFGRFGATVRDNPIPAVLAAFGIGWLIIAGLRTRPERLESVGTPPPPPAPRYADRAALATADREESVAGSDRLTPSEAEGLATEQEQRSSIASTTSRTTDAASEPAGRPTSERSG